MAVDLLALATAQPGRALPPGATVLDMVFAYGAIVLIVALIWWQSWKSTD